MHRSSKASACHMSLNHRRSFDVKACIHQQYKALLKLIMYGSRPLALDLKLLHPFPSVSTVRPAIFVALRLQLSLCPTQPGRSAKPVFVRKCLQHAKVHKSDEVVPNTKDQVANSRSGGGGSGSDDNDSDDDHTDHNDHNDHDRDNDRHYYKGTDDGSHRRCRQRRRPLRRPLRQPRHQGGGGGGGGEHGRKLLRINGSNLRLPANYCKLSGFQTAAHGPSHACNSSRHASMQHTDSARSRALERDDTYFSACPISGNIFHKQSKWTIEVRLF